MRRLRRNSKNGVDLIGFLDILSAVMVIVLLVISVLALSIGVQGTTQASPEPLPTAAPEPKASAALVKITTVDGRDVTKASSFLLCKGERLEQFDPGNGERINSWSLATPQRWGGGSSGAGGPQGIDGGIRFLLPLSCLSGGSIPGQRIATRLRPHIGGGRLDMAVNQRGRCRSSSPDLSFDSLIDVFMNVLAVLMITAVVLALATPGRVSAPDSPSPQPSGHSAGNCAASAPSSSPLAAPSAGSRHQCALCADHW